MMMQLPSKRRFKTPGPGTYNASLHPVVPTPPAFTIAGKASEYDLQVLDWEPGPGTYSAAAHRITRSSDGPSITIASRIASVAAGSAGKYSSDAPGPGAYNVSERTTALTRWREPSYSIAARTYTFHREISPGPGAYTLASDTYGPAFSIATRLKNKLRDLAAGGAHGRLSDSPGPGSYNSAAAADHQRPRSPIIYIGGGGRRKILCNAPDANVPGPGAYSQHKPPHGRTFTISGRRPARLVEESPGPGQYCADAAEPLIHPSEPMVSIAGRLNNNAVGIAGAGMIGGSGSDPTPGPGAYEPRKRTTAPAFTIAGKPHDRRPAPFVATHVAGAGGDNPGPGAYFTQQGKGAGNLDHVIGVSSPAIKIAGKNYPPPGSPIPGPGAYSPRYVTEGGGGGGGEKRGITIATKLNSCGNGSQSAALVCAAAENSPGPGNYFWDNKYYSNVSSPAISMGIRFPAPRGLAGSIGDAGPGPGSYNVAQPRGGPAFSIHSGSERYSFT